MAEPSLRVARVHRSGDRAVARAQYISARNMRFESGSRGHITKHDLHLGFELDFGNRTYTAFPANWFGSPKWSHPVSAPLKKSGRTTHYHFETIDTGERKE
ncbi:MAG: hypothetical protein ACRD45_06995 [Bryobacteraceae bacterium]